MATSPFDRGRPPRDGPLRARPSVRVSDHPLGTQLPHPRIDRYRQVDAHFSQLLLRPPVAIGRWQITLLLNVMDNQYRRGKRDTSTRQCSWTNSPILKTFHSAAKMAFRFLTSLFLAAIGVICLILKRHEGPSICLLGVCRLLVQMASARFVRLVHRPGRHLYHAPLRPRSHAVRRRSKWRRGSRSRWLNGRHLNQSNLPSAIVGPVMCTKLNNGIRA